MEISNYDVLVIGGGVIGVCAAYELAGRGARVTLIEQHEITSGASYGNGGLIVPSHCTPLASPGAPWQGLKWMFDPESPFYIKPRADPALIEWMIRFALASRYEPMIRSIQVLRNLLLASSQIYDEFAAQADFEFNYEQKGSLMVYLSQRALKEGEEDSHLLERFGVSARVMNARDVRELEPALSTNVAGGIHYLQDSHIDPFRFVTGLAEKAKERGVRILTKTEVLGFELSDSNIAKVRTTRGDFSARQVVLSAGSWSPALARGLKIKLPIQPAKGYSITLERPQVCPNIPLMFGEAHVVVTPLGGRLRLAGTLELAGMDFSINQRRVAAIRWASARYLTDVYDAKLIEIWRGLRPCTPDDLPIISRSKRYNNLIVATGHATLGMSLGPITGRLVAQLAVGEKTDIELEPLRLERFWDKQQ